MSRKPKQPVKQLVEKREYIALPDATCTLQAWIIAIELLIKRYGKDARIVQDAYYDRISDEIMYKVEESDAQYAARLKRIEDGKKTILKQAERKRVADLKEYKRLKKLFELSGV